MEPMQQIAQMARSHPQRLKSLKEKGNKLVGYMGRFVPEELIYATGAVPYLICRGGEPEPPEAVLPFTIRYMSPYTRTQVGAHLLGLDPVMPMLDLVVMQCLDAHESRAAELFEYFKVPVAKVGVPADWEKPMSGQYYHRQLARLRERLEKLTGKPATDETLRESIRSLNQVRAQLKKVNTLRQGPEPLISGSDFIRLNHYSFYGDPAEVAARLGEVHDHLRKSAKPVPKGPRVLLVGHVVAVGDYIVPSLIEESGGVIVAEVLDEGMRQHSWDVKADADPMLSLRETYYLGGTPPSMFQPSWARRVETIKGLIRDQAVDGVVWYQLFMEECYAMECAVVQKAMDEIKMPCLRLDTSYEYSREATGPLATRIESFIESLKKRGN